MTASWPKRLALVLLTSIMLSATVHELGHALTVVLLGGRLTEIQPFIFLGSPTFASRVSHLGFRGHSLPPPAGVI